MPRSNATVSGRLHSQAIFIALKQTYNHNAGFTITQVLGAIIFAVSAISLLVKVYVLPVAVTGFTWETMSELSTSCISGGSGNENDDDGK